METVEELNITFGLSSVQFSSVQELSSEFRSCVKVEVAVPGSPSLIDHMVSVDVKQH